MSYKGDKQPQEWESLRIGHWQLGRGSSKGREVTKGRVRWHSVGEAGGDSEHRLHVCSEWIGFQTGTGGLRHTRCHLATKLTPPTFSIFKTEGDFRTQRRCSCPISLFQTLSFEYQSLKKSLKAKRMWTSQRKRSPALLVLGAWCACSSAFFASSSCTLRSMRSFLL